LISSTTHAIDVPPATATSRPVILTHRLSLTPLIDKDMSGALPRCKCLRRPTPFAARPPGIRQSLPQAWAPGCTNRSHDISYRYSADSELVSESGGERNRSRLRRTPDRPHWRRCLIEQLLGNSPKTVEDLQKLGIAAVKREPLCANRIAGTNGLSVESEGPDAAALALPS
jgi:hypothetical protein